MSNASFLESLKAKGWSESAADGSWSKRNPLGTVDIVKPQPDPAPALDRSQPVRKKRPRRVVIIVTLISLRSRELDTDNLAGSFKPTRDAIAKSLGIDDGDKRFVWEYRQIETRGECGTIVRISLK